MGATPMRHIAKLTLEIHIPGSWSAEEKGTLEAAALGCPVRASLDPLVNVTMNFHWQG